MQRRPGPVGRSLLTCRPLTTVCRCAELKRSLKPRGAPYDPGRSSRQTGELHCGRGAGRLTGMRDPGVIDSELRLLAAGRRKVAEWGGPR